MKSTITNYSQCESIEMDFDPQIATIGQKLDYASCIQHYYASGISVQDAFEIGFMLLIPMLGVLIGYKIKRINGHDAWESFKFGMTYFMVGMAFSFMAIQITNAML